MGYRFSAFWLRSMLTSVIISSTSDLSPSWGLHTNINRSLWRNWLARSAVNRKDGGSSPPRDEKSFFTIHKTHHVFLISQRYSVSTICAELYPYCSLWPCLAVHGVCDGSVAQWIAHWTSRLQRVAIQRLWVRVPPESWFLLA